MKKVIKKFIKRIPFVKNQMKILQLKGPDLKQFLRQIIQNSSPTIIDVGANEGQTIDFMLDFFDNPRIYSFEPTLSLFNELQLKYQHLQNVQIFNFALGETNGEIEFEMSDYSPTNSVLKPDIKLYRKYENQLKLSEIFLNISKQTKVKIQTFNSWYRQNIKNEFIDIFKSDTQGFEYNVLKGAEGVFKNIGCVIVELQFMSFYQNSVPFFKICELLYENNFILYTFVNISRYDKTNQIIQLDAIFVNNKFV